MSSPVVTTCVARGIADPERVVIGGWSWGGYITLLALGLHPDRFAAGVAGVPVGDYLDSYDDSAPSLQAYDRTLVGGVVHDIPEFVAERSPITYVNDVRAPVFVLVGEHDTRLRPEPGLPTTCEPCGRRAARSSSTRTARATAPTSSTRRSASGARSWSSCAAVSGSPDPAHSPIVMKLRHRPVSSIASRGPW